MSKVRILIAEDHETVREGLKLILSAQSDIEVVGEASDGRAAVEHAKKLNPDEIWDLVNYVQSLPYESINNANDAYREAQQSMPERPL